MDARKLALLCRKIADDKKAENIVTLDVRKLSTVTDFFVIMSATSEPHMRAIADEISEKVEIETGERPRAVDGTIRGNWVVMDYVDVIIHIMRSDTRQHYDLEGLWSDAPRLRGRKAATPRKKRTPAGR